MEYAYYALTEDDARRLKYLIDHREELVDQMNGNFPGFLQKPCFMDGDFKYTGFHFSVTEDLLKEGPKQWIKLEFDKRGYCLSFSIKRNDGNSSNRLKSNSEFSVRNSQLFIELCYRFITEVYPARFGGKQVKSVDTIKAVWDQLVPKIMKDEVSGGI